MSKKLKEITLEEIEQKIHNHQLWLKGDSEDKRANFKGYDILKVANKYYQDKGGNQNYEVANTIFAIFMEHNLKGVIFEGVDLSEFEFNKTNLEKANFRNATLDNTIFTDASLRLTDFRFAKKFNFNLFTERQKKEAIFTDKEHEEKIIQTLNDQDKKIELQEQTIENTNEKQTKLLINGFEKIKEDFTLEERRWLMISIFFFIIIISLTVITIIDYINPQSTIILLMWLLVSSIGFAGLMLTIVAQDDRVLEKTKNDNIKFLSIPKWRYIKKTIGMTFASLYLLVLFASITGYINGLETRSTSLFEFKNPYYIFVPFSLALFSFLYFSICQYSKAKELRIENQNKIALLDGLQAINSNDMIKNKDIFYANVAHVVFTKAYQSKNMQNLPIDKIIELVNISRK